MIGCTRLKLSKISNPQSSKTIKVYILRQLFTYLIVWQVESNTFTWSILVPYTECGGEMFGEIQPNCGSQKHANYFTWQIWLCFLSFLFCSVLFLNSNFIYYASFSCVWFLLPLLSLQSNWAWKLSKLGLSISFSLWGFSSLLAL